MSKGQAGQRWTPSPDPRAPTPVTRWNPEYLEHPPKSSRTPTPLHWQRDFSSPHPHSSRGTPSPRHWQRDFSSPHPESSCGTEQSPSPCAAGAFGSAAALALSRRTPSRADQVATTGNHEGSHEARVAPRSGSRRNSELSVLGSLGSQESDTWSLPGSRPLSARELTAAPEAMTIATGEQSRNQAPFTCSMSTSSGFPSKIGRRSTGPPGRIAVPQVIPHAPRSVSVEWTAPDESRDPAFRYELQCRVEHSEHLLLIKDLGCEPRTLVNSLEPGHAYRFQVRGRNSSGEGPWSHWSAVHFVPVEQSSRRDGQLMKPKVYSDSSRSIAVQWQDPVDNGADIIGYQIQYGLDPDDLGTIQTKTYVEKKPSVRITGLRPNSLYHFRVSATNKVGNSAWSAWSDAVATKAEPPEQVPPPWLQHAGARHLVVVWDEPNTWSYRVLRYDVLVAAGDPTMSSATLLEGCETTAYERKLHVSDLLPNTSYYFQVRTVTSIGISEWSRTSDALMTFPSVPDRCDNLQVVENNAPGVVVLRWQVPESYGLPIKSFIVHWLSSSTSHKALGKKEVEVTDVLNTSDFFGATVTELNPGQEVFFKVAAKTQVGFGDFTMHPVEVITSAAKPSQPAPPRILERTKASCLLQVEDTTPDNGSPINRYEVQFTSGRNVWHMNEKPIPCLGAMQCVRPAEKLHLRLFEYPVTGLHQLIGPFFFQVRAVSAAGASAWSEPSEGFRLPRRAPPTKMAAPILAEAESCTSLLVGYAASVDLAGPGRGGLQEYEMRYQRCPAERCLNPEACYREMPQHDIWTNARHGDVKTLRIPISRHNGHQPLPVRVSGLLTGCSYIFQIRGASDLDDGEWSEVSEPMKTQPSIPDPPGKLDAEVREDENPFYMFLRLRLPESNGRPITCCKLRMQGPFWKSPHAPPSMEEDQWRDLTDISEGDCLISREVSHDPDASQPWVYTWDYIVTESQAGASYRFSCSCQNEVGTSEWSEPSEFITTSASYPEKPKPPYLAKKDHATPSSLKITWEPPVDNGAEIKQYILEWAGNRRFEKAKKIELAVELLESKLQPCYTLMGLKPNFEYCFRVAAVNIVGPGRFSDFDMQDTVGCLKTTPDVPGAVTGLWARTIETLKGSMLLRWEKPLELGGLPVTKYKIIYSEDSQFRSCETVTQKHHLRERKIIGLKSHTLYYFNVIASNDAGEGPMTDTVEANTATRTRTGTLTFVSPPPRRPEPPKLALLAGKKLLASWICPELVDEEAKAYPILYHRVRLTGCPTGGGTWDVKELQEIKQKRDDQANPVNNDNLATFGNLQKGWVYRAELRAFNATSASEWSRPSDEVEIRLAHPAERRMTAQETEEALDFSLGNSAQFMLTVCWRCPHTWPGCPEAPLRFRLFWRPTLQENTRCATSLEILAGPIRDRAGERIMDASECVQSIGEDDNPSGCDCKWDINDLEPATSYMVDLAMLDAYGKWRVRAKLGPVRTEVAAPGPVSEVQGDLDSATQNSVLLQWKAPSYTGGELPSAYDVRWLTLRPGGHLPPMFAAALGITTGHWLHLQEDGRLPEDEIQPIQTLVERAVDTQTTGSNCYHTIQGLQAGDLVLPLVRACNTGGAGPWSALPETSTNLRSLCTLPSLPAEMDVPPLLERAEKTDHRPYSLIARWTCPNGMGRPVQSFLLRLTRLEDGVPGDSQHEVQIPCHGEEETSWSYRSTISLGDVHVNLAGGVHYVMQVRAATEIGSASGWGSASLPMLAPPDVPVRPGAPSCHHRGATSIRIGWPETWGSGSEVHCCRFRFATNEDMADAKEASHDDAQANLTERTAVVSGLRLDECYHFQVSVQNSVGWSEWSEPSEGIVTQPNRPEAPAMPRLQAVETHQLTISWLPPHDGGRKIETYETVLLEDDSEQHSGAFACLLSKINCLSAREAEEALEQHALPIRWETLQADSAATVCYKGDTTERHCHSFTGLDCSSDYAIALRATNSVGISDWSPVLARLHTPPKVPDRCPQVVLIASYPTSLRCRVHLPHHNGAPIESVDLIWRYATGPSDRYLALGNQLPIGQRRLGAQDGILNAQVVDRQATYVDMILDGLRPGCTYNLLARAKNACGLGKASAMVPFECAPAQPDAPFAFRQAKQEEATVALPSAFRPAGGWDHPRREGGRRVTETVAVDLSGSATMERSQTLSAVGGLSPVSAVGGLSPAAGTDAPWFSDL